MKTARNRATALTLALASPAAEAPRSFCAIQGGSATGPLRFNFDDLALGATTP
jgi:hypothetical protein